MSNGVMIIVTVPTAAHEERMSVAADNEPTPSMQKVVEDLIEEKQIHTCTWSDCQGGNYKRASFTLESGDRCDAVLHLLSEWGIGSRPLSTVSVIPCSLYWAVDEPSSNGKVNQGEQESKEDLSAWHRIVATVKARVTVAQVVEAVRSQALLTFDSLLMVIIAGLIAALGLIENSIVILVASMLISPLMGPILAGTVGTMIRDKELMKMGVLNETVHLLICVSEGFLCGIIIGVASQHYEITRWPTVEMVSKGELHSVWIGIIIALLSGAGVAIAVLGANVASLVGVAISASLLPPAVNAGLLWALTCVHSAYGTAPKVTMPHIYTDHPVSELGVMGFISLLLTFVNIICIFVSGIVVLKLKAVVPSTSVAQRKFWNQDVKLAQEYKTKYGDDAKTLGRKLAEELALLSGGVTPRSADLRGLTGLNLFPNHADINQQPHFHTMYNVYTWSVLRGKVHQAPIQELHNLASTSPANPKVTITVESPENRSRRLPVIAEDTSIPSSQASSSEPVTNGSEQTRNQRFTVTVVKDEEEEKQKKQ